MENRWGEYLTPSRDRKDPETNSTISMSTWASPVIIVPKKGLELPKDPKTPLPVSAKLRLVCDYGKLNRKLPDDFWSYDKEG